jgi:ADP-ribosylglycohydrolase
MIPLETRKTVERFQGALVGIALGDAVGSPFDGLPPGTIAQMVGRVEGPDSRKEREFLLLRLKRGDRPKTVAKSAGMVHPPGLYYHCAQQALIATECILAEGDVGGESFARACVRFLRPSDRGKFGLHRKPSPAFRAGINRIAAGEDWRTAGDEPAFGETAVRAIPAGLAFREDPDGAAARAAELAVVTDRSGPGILAAAGAASLAGELSRRAPPVPPLEVLDALVERLGKAERAVREALGGSLEDEAEGLDAPRRVLEVFLPWILPGAAEEGDAEALGALVREARKIGFDGKEASAGFAPVLLAAAAYLCLTETRGPAGAVLRAVNLGRSSGTLGALTGGLAGALWGREAWPAEWLEILWNRQAILRMGELLARPEERAQWDGKLHGLEMDLNKRSKEEREAIRREILTWKGTHL